MPPTRPWTRPETLIAFRLYCTTPFGKLHQHNPDITTLARKLDRTPSAVVMKACNFASLDPAQQARGIKGLANRSRLEEQIWHEFQTDSESIAAQAEAAYEQLTRHHVSGPPSDEAEPFSPPSPRKGLGEDASPDQKRPHHERAPTPPPGPTETPRTIRARRVQTFFRTAVLISYDHRCALTGLAVPELLNASHIIPWSLAPHRRADPTNGLCLNALHDRAFDRGLITFDNDLRMMTSPNLRTSEAPSIHKTFLIELEGATLRIPERFELDREALRLHRETIFAHD